LIWIVDDSSMQATFTERSLGERYRYERFSDGGAIIERLAASTALPDLVLLDWVMPGLSGDEVCRYLRHQSNTRELPIVILTASRTATDDIVCALESGANDYVTKPFVAAELHARVGTILRAVEMQREAERERQRVVALNDLAASTLEATSVERVLAVMATWLVHSIVDGCAVSLVNDATIRQHSLHRSDEAAGRLTVLSAADVEMPAGELHVVKELSIRGIASARVVLTRDQDSGALDARDLLMIDTCLEYSTLAIEAALRSERERKTTRFHEEMVGIVGHDLRGPLSAFGIGLDMLRDGEDDAHNLDTLSRLQRSSTRMGRIVEQLLDVTRARIGTGIPVARKRVELRALVHDVLDEIRLARPGIDIQLRGNAIEGSWDRDRIGQVIANLAGNAAQYGREGAPITVEVSSTSDAASLAIHNQNRGAPISPEMLKTVFDPFERGTASGNVDGLGLGLYIVQQIVSAHRGTITVTSNEDGTTFRLTLPTDGN
jgi:signal transduction histidine kinase